MEWITEEPNTYYPAKVREFYANNAATLDHQENPLKGELDG